MCGIGVACTGWGDTGDTDEDGKIILRCIFREYDGLVRNGSS